MNDRVFFDTNILIYSITEAGPKTAQARALLRNGGTVSIQVLNELVAVARRKLGYDWKEIEEALIEIREIFPSPTPITVSTHEAGIRICARYGFRFYDSLIVASALESGCRTLYSEDMQHGQSIDGLLTIKNAFI